MAKDQTDRMKGLFKSTEPPDQEQPGSPPDQPDRPKRFHEIDITAGVIRSTGVGILEGERAGLEAIALELGELINREVGRNAIMHIAIERFLQAYQTGEITIEDLASYFEEDPNDKPRARRKRRR